MIVEIQQNTRNDMQVDQRFEIWLTICISGMSKIIKDLEVDPTIL